MAGWGIMATKGSRSTSMSATGWSADLGPHKAMILRNHGLLVGGTSIAEAFHMIYMLERACQAQVAALAGGASWCSRPKKCAATPPSSSARRRTTSITR